MELPRFKYHPDPEGTGSIVPSVDACQVCGKVRGLAYQGQPYSNTELEVICPWCIADGSAHEKFGAEFIDREAVGGYGRWTRVPRTVVEEVAFRTPGFNGWQQEQWFTHCEDAAEFLGPMGKEELDSIGHEAIAVIQRESGCTGDEWNSYYRTLNKHQRATAYLFRCRHCGQFGGYSDCT